jgi:hypothetical protein
MACIRVECNPAPVDAQIRAMNQQIAHCRESWPSPESEFAKQLHRFYKIT